MDDKYGIDTQKEAIITYAGLRVTELSIGALIQSVVQKMVEENLQDSIQT